LLERVAHLTDEQLVKMRRGGHSDVKLHAAYQAATNADGPTVILAKTVKGWTLGDGFEASNVTHQLKKMDTKQLGRLRDRLQLPIPDNQVAEAAYYPPGPDSPEVQYMLARREALGGSLPHHSRHKVALPGPSPKAFAEFV
jgi:pyruvate dehydrogenase E1 component